MHKVKGYSLLHRFKKSLQGKMNESLNKRMVWIPQKGHTLVTYIIHKFGCAISEMVGP